VRALFQRAKPSKNDTAVAMPLPETPTPGRSWLGWVGDQAKGGADQVVLLVKQIKPIPWLELHCHGGPEVIRFLQELFVERGAQLVSGPEFEREHDAAWRVAAQEILAHAPTVRTAAVALDQLHGAFQRTIGECRAHWIRGEREAARKRLRRLIDLVDVGRHLVQPWRVVLAGAPNVGKSSLGNALAGFARSIVSPTPGTTRDALTTMIALDGWPIELTDTAGLRASNDELEQAGIARARAAVASADRCVWLVDGAATPALPESPNDHMVIVINKIDLPPAWDWNTLPHARRVSSKTSAGVAELADVIVKSLVPALPEPGEAAPHTEEQWNALARIDLALRDGQDSEVLRLLEELS
jgi:tRNA modification GTPase